MNLSNLCRFLAVAGLLITLAAPAQDQQDPPVPTRPETPSAQSDPPVSSPIPAPAASATSEPAKTETPPTATPPVEGGETSTPAEADAQSPTRFIPTQKSTADNSATFPVDI